MHIQEYLIFTHFTHAGTHTHWKEEEEKTHINLYQAGLKREQINIHKQTSDTNAHKITDHARGECQENIHL